jgi:hypothetical protein
MECLDLWSTRSTLPAFCFHIDFFKPELVKGTDLLLRELFRQRNEEHPPELREPHSGSTAQRIVCHERSPASAVSRLAIIAGPPDLGSTIDDGGVLATSDNQIRIALPFNEVSASGLREGDILRVENYAEIARSRCKIRLLA